MEPPGLAMSLRKASWRLRPGFPGVRPSPGPGWAPRPLPALLLQPLHWGPPAGRGQPGRRAAASSPQPPSFPGEEQRIAQASGSGGGGGRKGERRKRDLNERR
jgi:hypothetical protein